MCDIFMGPTFYQRLKHMTADKHHCFTEDHEVLTKNRGWVGISDVTVDDEVACLRDGAMIYERPTKVLSFDYEGDMMQLRGDKIDLLATPNHRMWVAEGESGEYGFVEARDLDILSTFLKNAKNGDAEDMRIHKNILDTIDRVYETRSKEQADDLQIMALHAGYSADILRYGVDGYMVRIHTKDHDNMPTLDHVKTVENWSGRVYCLQVPSEVFYVRRNGKGCWTGNSRAYNGPIVMMTRQPSEGRQRAGGLRLGEMELECLWAHGIVNFQKERLMECSDNFRVFVCKQCGFMANVNPEKKVYNCRNCKNIIDFSEIRIPYACKLTMQEVQTMGIGCKILS